MNVDPSAQECADNPLINSTSEFLRLENVGGDSFSRIRLANSSAVGASLSDDICVRCIHCSMMSAGGLTFPFSYLLSVDCVIPSMEANSL